MNINLFDEQQLSRLKTLLDNAQHVVLCCHKSPDGDAIGSCLGWADFLRRCGKETAVVIPDAMPDFLQWLPGANQVVRFDKNKEKAEALFKEADLVCCLDFNSTHRVADMEEVLLATSAPRIVFDHHLNPEVPADFVVSHPNLCSASEIVFRVIWQLGGFDGMTAAGAEPI